VHNQNKEKRLSLIREYGERNPDFKSGKQVILYSQVFFIFFRIINSVCQATYIIISGAPFSFMNAFVWVGEILIAFIYAFFINAGIKPLVYLLLFGGLNSLYRAYESGFFENLNSAGLFFDIVSCAVLAAMLIQIASALFMLISRKANVFFREMPSLRKELSNWIKDNNPSA